MFTIDVPYIPVQDAPIVLVQAAAPGAGSNTLQPDYLLTGCQEIPSLADPTQRAVDPAGWLAVELGNRSGRDLYPVASTIKFSLLDGTTHGKLISKTAAGRVYYIYEAEPGYGGKDRAVFMAEFEGKAYRMVVNLRVAPVEGFPENAPSLCPEPTLIKLNPKPGVDRESTGSGLAK